jgi:hypothetical protein
VREGEDKDEENEKNVHDCCVGFGKIEFYFTKNLL